jgi:signal transduction histidine kinase
MTIDSGLSRLSFLAGGGEMGARIRAADWSSTPLGPPEGWPQSLRSTLSMLLPSKAQIILFWGDEFIVFYNDAYRPVFGAKHPDALGLPGRRAWSEIWDTQLHELLAGVVRTGEAFWAKDLLFEIERYGFAEETYFDVSYDPVRVESGAVGGVVCIVTETTERVVGERRLALLRDLAARNATARSGRDACVLAMETLAAKPDDITFALAYLDDELQGWTPDALQRLADAKPDLVKTLTLASSSAPTRAGRLVVGLNPRRPFDEQYRSFLDLVADQLSTALANARAYEAERHRAEALAAIDRAKTVFFSNVSHEFRTPLTLMLGPIENLMGEVNGPLTTAQRNEVDILQRNAGRLLKLVNALLDFSRIEAGRAQATYAPTDVCRLTRDIASIFRSAIERAGIRFEVVCYPIVEPVFVDHDLWEKIVLNLLSNALKFTFAGEIRVELRPLDAAIELSVADTGTGIPESELPRIFERFHRVEGAKSRTHEGTGIGLALTHELVRLHGGSIAAQSEVGRGTRFEIRIPTGNAHLPEDRVSAAGVTRLLNPMAAVFAEEAARWLPEPGLAQDAVQAAHAAVADGSGGRHVYTGGPERPAPRTAERVLVVDDNADMRDYLCQLLRERDVTSAADGRAALELARANPPGLIVTDVMMPEMDGFALLREIRSDTRTRAVPVLMISARAGEEARVSGLDAGADDYIVKPFGARELRARVNSLLNLSRARREAELQKMAAEAANRSKDQFLAILGHELRNPLAPILTALQLMTLRSDRGNLKERAVIDRQVRHLMRLVDDLLDVSRIARGKIELRHQTLEIADIVANAVEATSPLLEQRHHVLEIDVPQGLTVRGDATRLTQVVVNVLSNAAKYTEPHGEIRIEARRDGGHIALHVADSGTGISADMLLRIFEMFAQERQALDRSRGGLGLGLTIVKSLVELHEGTVEAHSAGPGLGSEFVIRLPAATAPFSEEPVALPDSTERSRISSGRRILVVDDNVDAAGLLAEALQIVGHETRVAFDGPGALDAAAKFQPHAALIDLGLPLMDGYELARLMIAAGDGHRPPILIAVTGYGQVADRQNSQAAGFDAHIIKPVDVAKLIAVLDGLFAAKPASLASSDAIAASPSAPEANPE